MFKPKEVNKAVRQNAYSIYDEKAQAYNLPFFLPLDGLAIRAFQDMATKSESVISRHPQDFVLYHIGTFDDVTGKMESFPEPKLVGRALEVIQMLANSKNSQEVVHA